MVESNVQLKKNLEALLGKHEEQVKRKKTIVGDLLKQCIETE
jgi:hypothetical protein